MLHSAIASLLPGTSRDVGGAEGGNLGLAEGPWEATGAPAGGGTEKGSGHPLRLGPSSEVLAEPELGAEPCTGLLSQVEEY